MANAMLPPAYAPVSGPQRIAPSQTISSPPEWASAPIPLHREGSPLPPQCPQPGLPTQRMYPSEPPPKYEPRNSPTGSADEHRTELFGGAFVTNSPVRSPMHPILQPHPYAFSFVPKTMRCPYCGEIITTTLTYSNGGLAWLASALICILGCWGGCCLIPFCLPDLQDVIHTCPVCTRMIGRYQRL